MNPYSFGWLFHRIALLLWSRRRRSSRAHVDIAKEVACRRGVLLDYAVLPRDVLLLVHGSLRAKKDDIEQVHAVAQGFGAALVHAPRLRLTVRVTSMLS